MNQPTVTPQDGGDGITAGVESLVALARRFGLTWRLVPATVAAGGTTFNIVPVTFDNDTTVTPTISMIGPLFAGARVFVMVIPPQGNYIIGFNGPTIEQLFAPVNVNASIGNDTTSSAGYSQLGGAGLEMPFTKHSGKTRVRVDLAMTAYSTVASTAMRVGLQLVGGTNPSVDVANFFFNAANTHAPGVGHSMILNVATGSYTLRPIWLRVSGTGVLTTDSGDYLSYTVQEVW